MIIVSGIIELDPANHDAAVGHMATLVEATLKEEGCIDYSFWADLSQPGRFRAFEQWESEEAIGSHFGQPHMATFMGALGELGVTATAIDKHVVSESSKLM